MNINTSTSDLRVSPFRNLSINCTGHSPIEIKDKLRKKYRNKIINSRKMLFNQIRGQQIEDNLKSTLTEIYKSICLPSDFTDIEENSFLIEIQNELIQDEYEWWLSEYSRSQLEDVDWSLVENDSDVICPLCEKANLSLNNVILSCGKCQFSIKTNLTLERLKCTLLTVITNHSKNCNEKGHFLRVQEFNASHLYFICDNCSDMILIV